MLRDSKESMILACLYDDCDDDGKNDSSTHRVIGYFICFNLWNKSFLFLFKKMK